jgi:hypothetical protein
VWGYLYAVHVQARRRRLHQPQCSCSSCSRNSGRETSQRQRRRSLERQQGPLHLFARLLLRLHLLLLPAALI